jgi:hypothetical protein
MMDIAPFARRRQALIERMGSGVAIVPTAPERIRNRDSDYLYRFDSYFYYLTAFPEPEAVLVLIAGPEPKSILFCRDKNPERELWEGFRFGAEAAQKEFRFDEAHSIAQLDELAPKLIADQSALYYSPGADASWDARVLQWLNIVRSQARTGVTAPAEIRDIRVPLDEMRLHKDAHELDTMRRAARISERESPMRRIVAPWQRHAPAARSTRSKRSCCTSFAAAGRSFRRTGRSSPAARMPACCTIGRTTPRSSQGSCCSSMPAVSSMVTPPT